ncbi:MAG: 3-hydroxyacyl-CoA dehydrogenase [Liquorilactobacillus nagelii]|nr:3-hydroxyacyl-CoA dehydrogenase [Liquorilactobacillus nagelii]MCC7616377.1 3-hydroxybutyryl-CoA dehydrogenase [Liquorilactobacillus nagelii]MCI1699816.1 3-hydroxyacyl-CoA dehydrogenase [Liquorilactobacillus nagelii]MCP9315136.1 3-hydroxyacyl-CoA dehydrogenase [Liquorilactobacillus nagelii]
MMFNNVTVAGSGTLGSQIAFQTAFKGFEVTIYDISDKALENAKQEVADLSERYIEEIKSSEENYQAAIKDVSYNANLLPNIKQVFTSSTNEQIGKVFSAGKRIKYSKDLAEAVADADLVIEAIPENVKIKTEFYTQLGEVAPEKTVFATNSSTLLPSQFAEVTGRPEKFLALHFANEIWHNNTAEIMGHAGTNQDVYDQVVEFAKEIGMIPIKVKKEQAGYILNSILVPLLDAAQLLYANQVGDPETIDKTWMLATGSPQGPFGTLDVVGIRTAYNIVKNYAETTGEDRYERVAKLLKEDFIDQGKLGVSTGEGFYKYPHPRYKDPDFLK